MLNNSEVISKNIHALRKAHKETQKELANALNIAPNTISMYEKGRREVTAEHLQLIAAHYGITIDSLIFSNLSQIDSQELQLTWENIYECFELLYPITVTPLALQNPDFAKGCELMQNVFDRIRNKTQTPILQATIFQIIDCFLEAMSANGAFQEASANLISLLFLRYSTIQDDYAKKIGDALMVGKAQMPEFSKKYLLKNRNAVNTSNVEKKQYANTHKETIRLLINVLKQSENYSDLADYYIALRYVLNLVDNEYSAETNRLIGLELIETFAELDNKYARTCIKKCENL